MFETTNQFTIVNLGRRMLTPGSFCWWGTHINSKLSLLLGVPGYPTNLSTRAWTALCPTGINDLKPQTKTTDAIHTWQTVKYLMYLYCFMHLYCFFLMSLSPPNTQTCNFHKHIFAYDLVTSNNNAGMFTFSNRIKCQTAPNKYGQNGQIWSNMVKIGQMFISELYG